VAIKVFLDLTPEQSIALVRKPGVQTL
jgi:hypothetical protein